MRDKMVVLLNSGGLDSCLAGLWLHKKGYTIYSLYIHWLVKGKVYNPRLGEAAQKSAILIQATEHVVFPLDGAILFGGYNKLPHRPACSSTMYYTIAAAYAFNIGARYVASGHMLRDKDNPNEKDYFRALDMLFASHFHAKKEKTKQVGLAGPSFLHGQPPVELLFPVFNLNNTEDYLSALGFKLSDLRHTYSCTFYPPCGTCFKCARRKRLGLD